MPRILIVDDDEQTRNLIREHLKNNYEIFDTGDTPGAFLMTLQHQPDAILMDLSMPGPSGFELCKTLSSLTFTQRIPIFIISGRDARNEAFCKSLGAVGYVKKPIDFERLKSLLAAALTSKKPEHRPEGGVQVGVPLMLKGRYKDGKSMVANAVGETMSAEGFSCTCTALLEESAIFRVFVASGAELNLGSACIAQIEGNTPNQRYRFKFVEQVVKEEGNSPQKT